MKALNLMIRLAIGSLLVFAQACLSPGLSTIDQADPLFDEELVSEGETTLPDEITPPQLDEEPDPSDSEEQPVEEEENEDPTDEESDDSLIQVKRIPVYGDVNALVSLDDTSVLIAGDFNQVGAVRDVSSFARLNNQKVDRNFLRYIGDGFNGEVHVFAPDPLSDSIYVGGNFTRYNDQPVGRLAKITSMGALDPEFNRALERGFNARVRDIVANEDGSLFVIGDFSTFRGKKLKESFTKLKQKRTKKGKLKISAKGILKKKTLSNPVRQGRTIASTPDGSVFVGGAFKNGLYKKKGKNGSTIKKCGKTWEYGGFNGEVRALAVDQAGSVYVGGSFTSIDSSLASGLAKLNSDCSIDFEFLRRSGVGFDGEVRSLRFDQSGNLWVGGSFDSYNGERSSKFIRIQSNGDVDESFFAFMMQLNRDVKDTVNLIRFHGESLLLGGVNSLYYISNNLQENLNEVP